MKKLVCTGSVCIDDYRKMNGGQRYAGGGPLNSAVYCADEKVAVSLISAIGNDHDVYFTSQLDRYKIDHSRLRIREGKTAVSEVQIKEGERVFTAYDEGVLKDFLLNDEDIAFMKDADLVLTDYWGKQEKLFPRLKAEGIDLVLDGADHHKELLPYCPYLQILFFSAGDLPDPGSIMKEYFEAGTKLVIATMGERGALAYDGDYHFVQAVECTDIKDSMGCGDAFIGTFLKHYLLGGDLEYCLYQANRKASEVLTFYGAFRQRGF